MSQQTITGKILFTGRIETLSPLHIGCGSKERSDLDALLDEHGKPFIPATAFVGVLRHVTEKMIAQNLDPFWGFTSKNDGQQSTVYCSDLLCCTKSPKTTIRDGIKIDNTTGIVKNQGKYDYELVERKTQFNLYMECSYNASNKELVRKMAATIYHLLKNRKIQIGAKTTSGFGAIQLLENTVNIYEFDLTNKQDVFFWLTRKFNQKTSITVEKLGTPFKASTTNHFSINASFWLKHSLIVRSYSADPKMPDATHITSGNEWILPGTSLKGAIRARAERIVNTLGKSESILNELFGYIDEETGTKKNEAGKKKKNAKKGKIRIEEAILPKFVSEMQTRIKIDRFTGGTIESALFDTMPLFGGKREPDKIINLQIHIHDCKDYEVGLLLLLLKDLWTGDLAVGGEKNVGRGIFQGIRAIIELGGEKICIEEDVEKLSSARKERLQGYVKALSDLQSVSFLQAKGNHYE